jgi:phosphonate transport system substrate-binding protein
VDLRLGIVSGARNAEKNLAALCDDLSTALDRRVTPHIFSSFAELRARLEERAIEIAWSSPIAAVRLQLLNLASIAVGIHREGGSSYQSAIFTSAASPIRKLEQLRGKRIAWVDPESAAGHVIPRQKLRTAGVTSFAAQLFEGSHEGVVRAVLAGRADAGATNVALDPVSGQIESAGWDRIAPSDSIRVLATAGPIPPDAIVVSRAVPEETYDKIVEALLALGSREYVQPLFGGHGFVLVGDYQYEDLAKMLQRA